MDANKSIVMRTRQIWQYVSREFPLWFIGLLTNWMPDIPLTCGLRGFLSRPFFKKCGCNFMYGSHVRFLSPHGLVIGDHVYIASGCWLGSKGEMILEDEVVIGPYCIIATGTHQFKNNSVRFAKAKRAPISIGKGTWLAAHVVVTPGVHIGSGNLVGANAVVIKSTPNNVLVGGVPAKVIRQREDNPSETKSRHG